MNASPDQEPCADVCAVVVTYNPDADSVRALLPALLAQAGRVVVVDNASAADVGQWLPEGDDRIELVRRGQNQGVAAAQNEGAARAMAWAACRYLLFLDQDSLPAPHMVQRLREALLQEADRAATLSQPAPVAAAGPQSMDIRTGEASMLIVEQWGWPGRWLPPRRPHPLPRNQAGSYDVSFLIASGSLVPVAVLRAIRGMRANYFIDHVDTEWCLRARAAGYRLLVVPDATLHHRLGDSVKRLSILGRRVFYHAPLRDYYMFRNTLLMLGDVPMPVAWRLHLVIRLWLFAGYFLTLGDKRRERLAYMWLGIRHGLRRISGRLDTATRACDPVSFTDLDPAWHFAERPVLQPPAGARAAPDP